ncbi:MAG: triple tyrosine motif-containing protein [Nonlabens sp.]|uniref:helix-turn-helix and ligand-binding sensor domain-containing protein n=1 Tax=Nonlabens sp. TaxID=1888209 RepID=UPI00321997EA
MKTQHYFFIFFLSFFVNGQELPPINNYEPSDYNAGNQNWMVSESEDHFIYVANNKGLLEYNGSQWNLYKTPNESIMRSVKVKDDRIYTGCYMDFGFWTRTDTGQLSYTSIIETSNFELQEDEQFWNIIVKNDYVLFQSLSHIYSFDVKSEKVTQIAKQSEINKLFQVGDSYYYHVLGEGLFQVINKKPQLKGYSDFFVNETIVLMFEFGTQIYLITQDADIYIYDNGNVTQVATSQFKEKVTVYSAALLSDNSLLLGTIANGVISMNLKGEINYSLNQADGLVNNTCLFVFEDSAKNVWFALDNGISSINIDSPYKIYSDKNGNLGTVYASYQSNDILYIGTNQGLFYKQDNDENFKFIDGTEGQVWSISEINGTIFCTHHLGVFILNDTNAEKLNKTIGTWQLEKLPNHPDKLLAGTYKGLQILKLQNDEWIFSNKIEGFDISSKGIVAFEDQVYVNHEYKGVFKIKLDDRFEKLVKLDKVVTLGKGIASDIIDFKGELFFSKRGEIYVNTDSSDDFIKDEELTKLVANDQYTSGTFIKNDGYLWLFTSENIHKINIEDINGKYNIESIPLSYELRKEKIGYENLTKVGPKKYLIGTSYGYTTLDQNYDYTKSHKVYINSFDRIDKNEVSNLSLITPSEIPYQGNHLQISYSSPFYQTLSTVEFQYRLQGQNEEWSSWSKSNSIEFKNLSYGDYTFEVKSRVNTIESDNIDSLSFTILRPYYLTNLAIIFYVILLVLLIIVLNVFYIWYFKKQKELALQKQQKELELKNMTNEKNLVELRNAKLRSDIEHRNKELAISTMAMIKKNETLNELKEELDNLPKSEESKSLKKMLDKNLNSKQDWLTFEEAFNNADKDFFKKIKELHPTLSSGDLRLCVYLRLNLSSKEIAPLLNISPRSVEIKRYRLRKKLALSREESLTSYIVEI